MPKLQKPLPYTIDNSVPLPTAGAYSKYPFPKMAVGDSFEFPIKDRKRIDAAATSHGDRTGWKFAVRTIKTIDKTIARCWRIA